jgi:hypothetical protein
MKLAAFFLGSTVSLAAISGAAAADLPVKAKPVEYVRICSLYGAGFYYIPGTDTCIKIGGYVRTEWDHNASGSFTPYYNGGDANFTRTTNTLRNRSRFVMSMDVRSQTEYGTLRAYARAGWQWTSQDATVGGSQGGNSIGNALAIGAAGGTGTPSNVVYLDRAMIQFAGFTFGKTVTFFEFFCTGCYSLMSGFLHLDNSGSGTPVAAYTAQFGNGLTATLSIEDYSNRRSPIVNTSGLVLVPGASNPGSNRGYTIPDIVGNVRVDQAWGSAQISGALHNNAASYYNGANQTAHPDDKWGWAIQGGLTLNMPWDAKDTFSIASAYCQGAIRYCADPSGTLGSGVGFGLVNTSTIGVGWFDDAYFNGAVIGSQLELSQNWNVVAGFQHYWTPTLRQSIYGVYHSYEAQSASLDAAVCGGFGAGCTDFTAWQVGSRLLWNPVANLDVGLDVMYSKVDSAVDGRAFAQATQGLPPVLLSGDTHVWAGIFRIQRNFWP